jgi:septum formation protein
LEILNTLRIPVVVRSVATDETPVAGESAVSYLNRVVRSKLSATAPLLREVHAAGVLVADTVVLLDGHILGKPKDIADAITMLRRLSGRPHQVRTRFALGSSTSNSEDPISERTVESTVVFRCLSEGEIRSYAATGEGLDKAGAYAVQGIGSFAVSRIEGSYSNVMGLPACEVVADLLATGLLASYPL